MEAFFRGSQTINSVTCGFRRSYSQAAEVPSSNVTCKSPRRPSIHCRIMLAFVSMTHSITIFPAAFITAIEMLSLCTSIPIYLVLVIKGVLSGWVEPNTQNPTPKGAPFYIASDNRSATCKAAENDCLERRNSIRPCAPSHVAYKAERGGNELFWSPWTMYPRSQERRRNREATVYLPALGGDGPRLDRTIRIYKCSQASSAEESLKCCAALFAVSTEA